MPNKILAFGFVGALLFVGAARADEHDKKTTLTVNDPLIVPGAVLQPGKYVMKLLNSQADRNIVEIFNEDENKLITMVLAIPDRRVNLTSDTALMYWETPTGPALRSWFFPGDDVGQEFAYPKQTADRISAANHNAQVPNYDASGQMSAQQLAGVKLNRASQSNADTQSAAKQSGSKAADQSATNNDAERSTVVIAERADNSSRSNSDSDSPNAERTDPNAGTSQRSAVAQTAPPVVTPQPAPADSPRQGKGDRDNTLLAQNQPAPANPAQQPDRPANTPANNNAANSNAAKGELPQTASPLGWMSIAGFLSIAGALFLRRLATNS